jgi:hypothetical protein
MISRSLSWMLVALGLGAFDANRASAQNDASSPLPTGTTACEFSALTRQGEPGGPALRDAPRSDGRELGRLPAIKDKDTGFYGQDGALPEFRVIGFKDGWFLIEDAAYPEPYRSKLAAGRGWIDAKFVTTHLFRDTLKKAPDNASPDVTYLYGTSDGIAYQPYVLDVQLVGCSGRWLEVEVQQPNARTPSGMPVSTDGTVRGWTDRSCTVQDRGPCTGKQFDYAWSPLPAGVTECNFGALSGDPDPAGLNVRAAPDRNAPVLGRLAAPESISRGTLVVAEVHVIGFQKGWFLIKSGPFNDADLPPKGPKPFSGRGWVAGNLLTVELLRNMLKQAPSETAADVVDLRVEDRDGTVLSDPQDVKMRRILACSGDWVKVEIAFVKGMKPLLETDAPAGAVRGWANGTCTAQLTTCDFDQSRPWSPPAPLPPE